MEQVQVAYIGNAGGGNGTLFYQGIPYPFTVAGLGVGGIGASTVDAEGEVYKLHNLSQFAGSYAQASYGFVFGTKSAGDLWMQNEAGVIMHLKAKRTGLMLSLGGEISSSPIRVAQGPRRNDHQKHHDQHDQPHRSRDVERGIPLSPAPDTARHHQDKNHDQENIH
jgi:hypothetical protein